MVKNIFLSKKDKVNKNKNKNITYVSFEELENMYIVDDYMEYNMAEYNDGYMSHILFLQEEYNSNYTKKQLSHICGYYKLTVRKKNKEEIINDILCFEFDEKNDDIVTRRRKLWDYVEEIKNDKYLKKYIILD
tara:strand:- start:10479 stop:10877 length:399 start_codon:yes stop_codon:yes gene_type:complete